MRTNDKTIGTVRERERELQFNKIKESRNAFISDEKMAS